MFRKKEEPPIIYVPKEDITAYELALILKLFIPYVDKKKIIDDMPLECKRHLKNLDKITDKL